MPHDCVEIEYVFARGSGQEINRGAEWTEFNDAMREMSAQQGYSYRVQDLVYRAISVAKFKTLAGAYVSAGRYYEFGASVRDGVNNLRAYYDDVMAKCPNTRWVLAGYSQGAMVVAEAVKAFAADKVIYVGLLGDPELSLPEGSGIWPTACRGGRLSPYRVYVPYCKTYSGVFGRRSPYQYGELRGKYGLWCAKNDYICGSSKNPMRNSGHFTYADVGVAWMADIVMAKLPRKRRASVEPRVYAVLPLDEYFVAYDEEVVFDASQSFSSSGNIESYEWNVGNGWLTGEELFAASFAQETVVSLRVTDSGGISAETSAVVKIGNEPESALAAPVVNIGKDESGIAYVTTDEVPLGAKYLLVRLNGFDLGFVEAGVRMRIGELKYDGTEKLSFAWLNDEYDVGDAEVIDSQEVMFDAGLRPTFDEIIGEGGGSVMTGVSLGNGEMLIAVGLIVLVIVLLNKKDARRLGGRPREGP